MRRSKHIRVYYNELDPYAAQWLRNLIDAGQIPEGTVDEKDIKKVKAGAVADYRQCHFFAGIAGWSLALQAAGWPKEEKVWTGSCPCQPFSNAGKRRGTKDPRHLWPVWRDLIAECRPTTIFGEQTASAAGREWLSGVHADLEALGYAVGAADLCAACVGAPHIRQRLWWVADANNLRRSHQSILIRPDTRKCPEETEQFTSVRVDCLDGKTRRIEPGLEPLAHGVPARVGKLRAYGNAIVPQIAAEFVRAYLLVRVTT